MAQSPGEKPSILVQLDPDPGEADQHQADAVETVRRIAPLQPERRSDQLARRDGKRDVPLHQDCEGYRATRSLPGKKGSPRKFSALPKRAAQVAIVRSQP